MADSFWFFGNINGHGVRYGSGGDQDHYDHVHDAYECTPVSSPAAADDDHYQNSSTPLSGCKPHGRRNSWPRSWIHLLDTHLVPVRTGQAACRVA